MRSHQPTRGSSRSPDASPGVELDRETRHGRELPSARARWTFWTCALAIVLSLGYSASELMRRNLLRVAEQPARSAQP